jgi:hypothetical protein
MWMTLATLRRPRLLNEEHIMRIRLRSSLRSMFSFSFSNKLIPYSQHATIDPGTSHLLYPRASSSRSHALTPLFPATTPRHLPIPRATVITTSHDGRHTIAFHPNSLTKNGGSVSTYLTHQILSPLSPGMISPITTLPLLQDPISILPLYPSRIYTKTALAPSLGPTQRATKPGPVFLILTATSLVLSTPGQTLQAPLNQRFHASSTTVIPGPDVQIYGKKGWMGLIGGDEGVYTGYEGEKGICIVLVEIGLDGNGNYCA